MIKIIFFALFVKPIIFIILGLNIYARERLPKKGPTVLAANHNSHLDVFVLMSLYPLKQINKVKPVAAKDYFFKNKYLKWFALNCIGIIPIDRKDGDLKELYATLHKELDQENIIIFFPEGSRGDPEKMGVLKKGLYYLLNERNDNTQAIPIFIHGLGKALPKNAGLLVPLNCDVIIGSPLKTTSNANEFVSMLTNEYEKMAKLCLTK